MTVRVKTDFGRISLPNAQTVQFVSDQELVLEENLRDTNNAISSIGYVLESPFPNYNSQTKGDSIRPSLITVSFDKTILNTGLDDFERVGQISASELPIHVIAVNDPPRVLVPETAEAIENLIAYIPDVSVEDPDVDEVCSRLSFFFLSVTPPCERGEARSAQILRALLLLSRLACSCQGC